MFEIDLLVGWGDVDALGHMANTAYLNKAADARLAFLASQGFAKPELMNRGLVPVARRDEVDYVRELHFHQQVTINFRIAGLSEDCSKGLWVNEFHRSERLAARVTTTIVFLDLHARRLAVPPDDLAEVLRAVPRTDDFATLDSAVVRPVSDGPGNVQAPADTTAEQ